MKLITENVTKILTKMENIIIKTNSKYKKILYYLNYTKTLKKCISPVSL